MTWEEVSKVLKIERTDTYETNRRGDEYIEVNVHIPVFNKRINYKFMKLTEAEQVCGPSNETIIRKKIIQAFELDKWVGKIEY